MPEHPAPAGPRALTAAELAALDRHATELVEGCIRMARDSIAHVLQHAPAPTEALPTELLSLLADRASTAEITYRLPPRITAAAGLDEADYRAALEADIQDARDAILAAQHRFEQLCRHVADMRLAHAIGAPR